MAGPKRLNLFERYLTLGSHCAWWPASRWASSSRASSDFRELEFGEGSQINVPIAVLIWLMIYPMMLKIDFASILGVRRRPAGLLVTLFVNWLVKPFSMAFLGWLFFKHLFLPLDRTGARRPVRGRRHHPGGRALHGDGLRLVVPHRWRPAYTLVQVSLNDLIMLVLFAPIVKFLVPGRAPDVPFRCCSTRS